MPDVYEAPQSINDLLEQLLPTADRRDRQYALETAIKMGTLVSMARTKAVVLAHHVRTPQRWSDMLAVCATVRVALDLIITTQRLCGAEKTDPTLVLLDTWRGDEWTTRLAPAFIHAAQYVREHEELHGSSARAMESFNCDAAGNRVLFATASTMSQDERRLLHELLSLCSQVTMQMPPVRPDAERSDAPRYNGR